MTDVHASGDFLSRVYRVDRLMHAGRFFPFRCPSSVSHTTLEQRGCTLPFPVPHTSASADINVINDRDTELMFETQPVREVYQGHRLQTHPRQFPQLSIRLFLLSVSDFPVT